MLMKMSVYSLHLHSARSKQRNSPRVTFHSKKFVAVIKFLPEILKFEEKIDDSFDNMSKLIGIKIQHIDSHLFGLRGCGNDVVTVSPGYP